MYYNGFGFGYVDFVQRIVLENSSVENPRLWYQARWNGVCVVRRKNSTALHLCRMSRVISRDIVNACSKSERV